MFYMRLEILSNLDDSPLRRAVMKWEHPEGNLSSAEVIPVKINNKGLWLGKLNIFDVQKYRSVIQNSGTFQFGSILITFRELNTFNARNCATDKVSISVVTLSKLF